MKRPRHRKGKAFAIPSARPTDAAPAADAKAVGQKLLPIAGIGASAGGLQAFQNLLSHLPQDTGMAFVLVQHLDPTHSSALDEILSRASKMPVAEVSHDTAMKPDHVYVIPANADMLIKAGTLQLHGRSIARGQHRPIDIFLHSLSEDTGDQAIAVILSGTDIDAMKRALEGAKSYADAVIESAREPIIVLDDALRVVVANRAFYGNFQVAAAETENQLIYDLGNRQWDIPKLRELLGEVTKTNSRVDDFEVCHTFPSLGERIMRLNARRMEVREGQNLIILSIQDVTERRKQVQTLETQTALLELAHDTVMVRTREGKILFWNRGAEEMYGWKKEEALGKITHQLLHTEFSEPFEKIEAQLRRSGYWEGELVHTGCNGQRIIVGSRWAVLEQGEGKLVILEINTDITEKKASEESLRQLTGRLLHVQDEERRRMARELHDSTGQKLAVAKLHLDTMVKAPALKSHASQIKESAQLIDEAFQEVRTLSQLLHPPLLDETGLLSATRWLVDGFSERSKIRTEFQTNGEPASRLPQAVELTLFRIIQEALSNIHRHSQAKNARVVLTQTAADVTLEIQDDGKGIPKDLSSGWIPGKKTVGVGILGMKERLAQLGGTLEITSGKKGTTVRVMISIEQAAKTSG